MDTLTMFGTAQNGESKWVDISNYITDVSFEPLTDAFEDLGNAANEFVQRNAWFTMYFDLLPLTWDSFHMLYGSQHPAVSKAHKAYRAKTRRRNRRR